MTSNFRTDDKVKLIHLKNENLVGKAGELRKYDELKHRWEVLVEESIKSVKAENLGKLYDIGL